MAVKENDAAVCIRKYLLFSLKSTYRFACGHPFVSSFALSLFLLHSFYPFLFAFLVSSSPVLICAALLLGILLCHGEPNIPEIEEEHKLNQKVSPLKVERYLDDCIVKKDKNYTLESATDDKNEIIGDFLAVSASVGEQNNNVEGYNLDHGFVENGGDLMSEQPEFHVRLGEVIDGEGLSQTTSRAEPDDYLDSSLGSPWQRISVHDAASDSESDEAESSSTDASMTDILPMLNELRPLLDSKPPKSVDSSDAEISHHHESDEGSVEHEDEHRTEGSDASNKIVTWTADDQKNVMELGSSDLERNRRLESLIARRRARKNQIIIFEQDLIDLHSNEKAVDELFRFHPQIPPISTLKRNPFDFHHDSETFEGYPPVPGSAPSVLVHRQSPFDFPSDSENGSKGLDGDSLFQPEIEPPSRRSISFRRYGSFSSRSLIPTDVMHEKNGSSSSRLKHCVVGETMGLESYEHVDLDNTPSPIDPKHQKELTEEEMHETTDLPVSLHDTMTSMQDQSYRGDFVDSEIKLVGDEHFVDPNVTAITEGTHQSIDTFVFFKEEHERTQLTLDGQKNVESEEIDDEWTLFTSSEDKEKSLPKALQTMGQITIFSEETCEFVQSSDACVSHLFFEMERVDNSQASVPFYDSSPSGSGNFITNIYVPDDTLLSSEGGPNSTSMESHVQEDVIEAVSHAKVFEENMTSEMMEFEMVHESKLQNSVYSSGEPVTPSTHISLLDQDVLTTKGVSETGAQGFTDNRSPGIGECFGQMATMEVDHSSGFSLRKANLDGMNFAISGGLPTSNVEAKHLSLGKHEMQGPLGSFNFELGDNLKENSEDVLILEEQVSLLMPNLTSSSTPPVLEELTICKSSVGQEVIPLHSQSEEEEEAGDEGTEKGIIAFPPENAKPSKTSNLVLANDDKLFGLLERELLESMKFSNLYKTKSGVEFSSIDDINDHSQASDINEISQDVIFRNLNESYAESWDVDTEDREIQCFDESLLSELDAVGDFQVGFESQQHLQIVLQSASQLDYSTEPSMLERPRISDSSPKRTISDNPNSPHKVDLVLNQKETTDSGFWSLAMTPVEDLTVYKSKFNVLQACSVEELDSTFKQDLLGEYAVPSLSETISDKFVAVKVHAGLSISDQEVKTIPHEATLLTPNKKTVEDIGSDLIVDGGGFGNLPPEHFYFQLNDNHSSIDGCNAHLTIADACEYDPTQTQSSEIKAVYIEDVTHFTLSVTSCVSAAHEAGASSTDLDISSKDLETGETDSKFIAEANMIEDTDSSFKLVSDLILNKSISPPVNPEPMITHQVDNVVEAMSHEVEKSSGLLFLEAKSIDDLNSAFEEATREDLATPTFCSSDPNSSWTQAHIEKMELNSPDNASELFVLEAKSTEDIQFGFKQAIEGVSTIPTFTPVNPDFIGDTQVRQVVEDVYSDTQEDSELLVPEGKSSEDINCDLKHFDIVSHSNVKLEADDTGPFNAENDTEQLAPSKKFVAVTSDFQQTRDQGFEKFAFHQAHTMSFGSQDNDEIVDAYSLETQIDSEFAEDININSALKQDNEEYPAHSTSQDDPELRYFHPGHDLIKKNSFQAEDNSEIFAESKIFEDAHLDSKKMFAAFLVNPEHNPESPDSHNDSRFLVAEGKSLEGLNSAFKQTAKDCPSKPIHKDNTDYVEVIGSSFALDNYSELVVAEENSFVSIQSAFAEATIGDCEVSTSLPAVPKPIETLPGEKDTNMCFEVENNSEILVIEATPFDDVSSVFKLPTSVPSSPLLTDTRSFDFECESSLVVFEAKSDMLNDSALAQELLLNENDEFMEENSLRKNDLELLVLEEKSIKDIDSALKQVTKESIVSSLTHEADSKPEARSEILPKDSELFILEPLSVGDSDVIVKQVSEEEDIKTSFSKNEEDSTEGISQEMDEHGYATASTNIREWQHEEEISTAENEGFVYEDPGYRPPTTLNLKKKGKKSLKSDSSSSSSSSSSDSE